jgi:transcription initiation factor TFIIH subunit 3
MKRSDERSLIVIVIDVSPLEWGKREFQRNAADKKRVAGPCLGPARLEELLCAVQAFCSASSSVERDAVLVIVAVAASEVAVVYPRKDALEEFFSNPENKLDSSKIQQDLTSGVAELVAKAVATQANNFEQPVSALYAAMASAFSMSLCLINRFLVASNAGVSALHDHHSWNRGNGDDDGVITALSGGGGGESKKKSQKARAWSPRIVLIQASDDRPADYNAFMNCAFAAVKQNIVVDCCYLPINKDAKDEEGNSAYLLQTSDMTGGLYSALKGASQADNCLTEALLTVFLPPRSTRKRLTGPASATVDFRARSFDTGQAVDIAHVCNQCLSIFSQKPTGRCPTCEAEIKSRKHQKT